MTNSTPNRIAAGVTSAYLLDLTRRDAMQPGGRERPRRTMGRQLRRRDHAVQASAVSRLR